MTENKDFTCIVCPRGCRLYVKVDGESAVVSGNACARGEEYGKQEAILPLRSLTTTVRASGGIRDRVSVRTAGDIPLERLLDAMTELDTVDVRAPVRVGDLVLADILGLGVDVIATDDLPASEPGPGAPHGGRAPGGPHAR